MLLTSILFTQHTPSLFELFLVDLAFGEPLLGDVQGRLARRAVKSTAMPRPTEPAHQEHDHDHHDDEYDYHERAKDRPAPSPSPWVVTVGLC